MSDFERVASLDEIPADGRLSVLVDDVPVLLVRTADRFLAIEDVCSHDGQPLTDGTIADGQIVCSRHGARFDLTTGKALCMPATSGVRVYSVEIRGTEIYCRESDGTMTPTTINAAAADISLPTAEGDCCGGHNHAAGSVTSTCDQHVAAEKSADEESNSGRSLDEKFLEALRQVIDPELLVNIVDLGLIYCINFDGSKAYVDMTLTSPMCPAGPQLVQQSKMALERLREVDEAVIKIVMSPPWSPDRMTDEARDQLGIF
jgi:metal-sulfur cluster biosynthetic enzyme/nitrite reductase/ring-hydroxylating ferredoxin subunit